MDAALKLTIRNDIIGIGVLDKKYKSAFNTYIDLDIACYVRPVPVKDLI